MQDLKNNIGVVQSLAPAARDADANGTGVDLQGFESATVVIDMGAEGITLSTTNKIEIELEHSDDDSTYTDVTSSADVIGATPDSSGVIATFDANEVIIILFLSLPIILSMFFLTSNSEPDLPALNTLVESQIIARTPSSPISFNLFELISSPISGLGSTFQSPVCNTTPAGVWILSPFGSKIECVNVIYSISKGSNLTFPFNSTICKSLVISICFSLNFSLINTAVKGVA